MYTITNVIANNYNAKEFIVYYKDCYNRAKSVNIYQQSRIDYKLLLAVRSFFEKMESVDYVNAAVLKINGKNYIYETCENIKMNTSVDPATMLAQCTYSLEDEFLKYNFELFNFVSIKKDNLPNVKPFSDVAASDLIDFLFEKVANMKLIMRHNISTAFEILTRIKEKNASFVVDYLSAGDKEDFFMDVLMEGDEEQISFVEEIVSNSQSFDMLTQIKNLDAIFTELSNASETTDTKELMTKINDLLNGMLDRQYYIMKHNEYASVTTSDTIKYINDFNMLTSNSIKFDETVNDDLTIKTIKKLYAN